MSKLGKILISVGSCLVIAVVAISIYIFCLQFIKYVV